MKPEWSTTPLSELTEIDSPITYGVVKPGPEDTNGVLFIRGGDISEGRILVQQLRTITSAVSDQYRRTQLRGGELVVSLVGNPGQVAIVPEDLRGANIARQAGLVRLRQDVDSRFVRYFLSSKKGQEALGAHSLGSVQQVINLRDLKTIKVPTPPLAEQRAIAHILGTLDDKIELNRRMNETLEAMARALFKSWFVDFDPVRAKAEGRAPAGLDAETAKLFPSELVESELGPIPKVWSALPLYDLATYVNGAAYKAFQPNNEGRGLPIIKIAELKAGITAQTKFSDIAMPEKYRLRTGDILFSWSGNPDTSIDTFIWAHGNAWLNQHIFRVDLRNPSERPFVVATLKYLRPVFAEIARNKQTTGLGHVTAGDLQRLLVVKPDEPVLIAWDRVAAPVFAAVFNNELESIALARTRDQLLPRLLAGELTVAHAERAASEVA